MSKLRYILPVLVIGAPVACGRDKGGAESPETHEYVPPPSTTNEPAALPPDTPMPPESPPGAGTPSDTSGPMPGGSGTDKTLDGPLMHGGGMGGMGAMSGTGGMAPAPRGGIGGARSIGMR